MIYIDVNWNDPYLSFGLEYYLVKELRLNDTVFLFWNTSPTLMIGKYQNSYGEINMDYAKAHNINIVRRKSGGGTIYTDLGGYQFSFIRPLADGEQIELKSFILPIASAIRNMGADVEFSGRNDLLIRGKKCSGNAQYREDGYIVHHGSLLFDTDINELVRSTSVSDDKLITKGIKSVRERVCNLKGYLRNDLFYNNNSSHQRILAMDLDSETPEQIFKRGITEHILHTYNARVYHLNAKDMEKIKLYADLYFRNQDTIYKQNPTFENIYSKRLKGGLFEIRLTVKHNIITEIEISGDFFATIDIKELEDILKGKELRRDVIAETLSTYGFETKIFNTEIEEFLDILPLL